MGGKPEISDAVEMLNEAQKYRARLGQWASEEMLKELWGPVDGRNKAIREAFAPGLRPSSVRDEVKGDTYLQPHASLDEQLAAVRARNLVHTYVAQRGGDVSPEERTELLESVAKAIDRRSSEPHRSLPLRLTGPQRRIRLAAGAGTQIGEGDVISGSQFTQPRPVRDVDSAATGVRRTRQRQSSAAWKLLLLLRPQEEWPQPVY